MWSVMSCHVGAYQFSPMNWAEKGENMERRMLVGSVAALVLASASSIANAAVVTIWEDQFTSVSSDWTNDGADISFVSQAYGGAGGTDGFEALVTPLSAGTHYTSITIPPAAVAAMQIGDILEISTEKCLPYRCDYLRRIGEHRWR